MSDPIKMTAQTLGEDGMRICWPKPDATCLQGGCSYCHDEPLRTRSQVESYAQQAGQVPNRCGEQTVDAWDAYNYGQSLGR